MKLIATSLLLLALSAQQPPVQLTPIPPKPTCILIFETGSCADLWRNYTEALAKRRQEEIHLYVNRQEELASQAATPQQIADLNKLKSDLQAQTTKLQKQMQEVRRLRRQGIEEAIGIGVGGLLIFIAVVFGARRLSRSFLAKTYTKAQVEATESWRTTRHKRNYVRHPRSLSVVLSTIVKRAR